MAAVHHAPITEIRRAVAVALAEDLTPLGDLSAALVPDGPAVTAAFVPRRDGVLAGTRCATEAFAQLDPDVEVRWSADDGDAVAAGATIGEVVGPLASILTGERTALNFLNHLSGVATLTRRYVDAAAARGGTARVWDTRKTTPGLRSLEKAAVRAGGGWNHRGNLSDWVMFKDNHLTRLGIAEAVRQARATWPARTIHVEADSLDKVEQALAAGADAILLDNLSPAEVREAVALADGAARRPLLEASGGITIETIADYAATGVDVISTSHITISAPVLDIGLDIDPNA
ncbi:MAG: carboxylating nicotinate-nucleotide diphosphorylase [Acidimicrobiia bacterium]|nr:carboxylating nicotinate-nucleotide diphosphorylase [Acidimicrobiia bacterium]